MPPNLLTDEHRALKGAAISAYGDTVHTFIERSQYKGAFAPNFKTIESKMKVETVGLRRVDHVVANVEEGKMDYWVERYGRVVVVTQLVSVDDKEISSDYSVLSCESLRNLSGV